MRVADLEPLSAIYRGDRSSALLADVDPSSDMSSHPAQRARRRCATGCAARSSRFGESEARVRPRHDRTRYDEAAYLLLHALHLPLDRLEPFLDARLTQAERQAARAACLTRRIDERVPAAYLTHEAWLGEFRFYVDERVIIPRSFIAELLAGRARALSSAPADGVETALDMCTGSGCLAILLAHAYPEADVDAVDISSERADRRAAQRRATTASPIAINLIRSDLFANLSGEELRPHHQQSAVRHRDGDGRRCPPNTGTSRRSRSPAATTASTRVRDPGRDAPRFLNHGGTLVVEIGHNRDAAETAFPRAADGVARDGDERATACSWSSARTWSQVADSYAAAC